MNKRTFLKLSSATMASPAVRRFLAWAGTSQLTNWAGNLEYSTDRLYAATSFDEVQDFVKTQAKLKVLGTRHCFNNIADTKDIFLHLKRLDEIVSLDPQARSVTVDAGITYGQLSPLLHNKGFALPQSRLPCRTFLSLAPAAPQHTAPAKRTAILATAVSALEVVDLRRRRLSKLLAPARH